jgi:hypothetical protein
MIDEQHRRDAAVVAELQVEAGREASLARHPGRGRQGDDVASPVGSREVGTAARWAVLGLSVVEVEADSTELQGQIGLRNTKVDERMDAPRWVLFISVVYRHAIRTPQGRALSASARRSATRTTCSASTEAIRQPQKLPGKNPRGAHALKCGTSPRGPRVTPLRAKNVGPSPIPRDPHRADGRVPGEASRFGSSDEPASRSGAL